MNVRTMLMVLFIYSAFAVGLVSNVYGRFFGGNAFVVMVCKIRCISCDIGANAVCRLRAFFSKSRLACRTADCSNLRLSNRLECPTRISPDSRQHCSSYQWRLG